MFKLLHYAEVTDVTFIRKLQACTYKLLLFLGIGTSGGVGVPPGTVIITNGAINSQLRESYDLDINGRPHSFPCQLDQLLADQLYRTAAQLNYQVDTGKTLCANDFYEGLYFCTFIELYQFSGQMRLDGCFYQGEAQEKFEFLKKIR
jgi:uridine phosphorylase